MKSLINTCFVIIAVCLFLACSENEPMTSTDNSSEDLNIFFGSFGGLCGYSDSLSISSDLELYFELRSFCMDIQFQNNETISQAEYAELVELISLEDFEKLSINSCDRCLDGLDTFVNIKGEAFDHRILYGSGDDVSSIQNFIDKLNEIRESQKSQ